MCFSGMLSSLKKRFREKYMIDGPGMVNTRMWDSFSVSRSGDSYAENNFCITVKYSEDGYIANGSFINTDGEYSIELPRSAGKQIDELQPHNLPNYISNTSFSQDEDLFILDAPDVDVEVTYTDGTLCKKIDEDDFSLKVYNIVRPHFKD